MKFYGHANLQQNELQSAVFQTLTAFPQQPKIGQVAFVNSIVYICVIAGSLPVWVPLTNEITAYTHTQNSALSTWNITHGLNTTSVHVQVYNEFNEMVIPNEVEPTGPNTVTVSLNTPATGKAIVLTGHFDGNVKPTYAFEFFQSAASDEWVINHGLGYNPIIRVFIGTQEVQPTSITHVTTNQTVITFTTPQVGVARLI